MNTGSQPLRKVNRILFSSRALELGRVGKEDAAHVSAGLQIHHPKGNRRLTSTLHFSVRKPKGAKVVLTIHHGIKTKTLVFPFEKTVIGNKAVRFRTSAFSGMGRIQHISIHAYAHRKNSKASVRLKLIGVDVSS